MIWILLKLWILLTVGHLALSLFDSTIDPQV